MSKDQAPAVLTLKPSELTQLSQRLATVKGEDAIEHALEYVWTLLDKGLSGRDHVEMLRDASVIFDPEVDSYERAAVTSHYCFLVLRDNPDKLSLADRLGYYQVIAAKLSRDATQESILNVGMRIPTSLCLSLEGQLAYLAGANRAADSDTLSQAYIGSTYLGLKAALRQSEPGDDDLLAMFNDKINAERMTWIAGLGGNDKLEGFTSLVDSFAARSAAALS